VLGRSAKEENDFVGNDFVEILWVRLCRARFFVAIASTLSGTAKACLETQIK
jgi:hypothetical protein